MDFRVGKAPPKALEIPDLEKPTHAPPRSSRLKVDGHQMNLSLAPDKHLSKIAPPKHHVLTLAETSQILPPKNELPQSVSIKREVFSSHSELAVASDIAHDLKIDQKQSLAMMKKMTSAMAALSDPAKLKGQNLTKQEGDFLALLSEKTRTTLADMLSDGPLLCAMTFGGSRVRGNFHANSDLDIGVEVFQDPDLRARSDLDGFRKARSELETALLEGLVACGTSEVPVEKGIKIQPGYRSKNISTIHDPAEFFLRSGRRTSPLRQGETEKPSFSSSGAHSYFFDGAGCYGRLKINGDHPPNGIDEKHRLMYPREQREAYQKLVPCV